MNSLKEVLQAGARNNAWSNFALYKACLQLTQEEFTATRTSFFPSLQLTLNHILLVDIFYFEALNGGTNGTKIFQKDILHENCADLWTAQKTLDKQVVEFCDALTEERLATPVHIHRHPRIVTEAVAPVLNHMFVHQIHHRGQVHAMLSGTKIKPPQLDEFYLHPDVNDREPDLAALTIKWPNQNPLL